MTRWAQVRRGVLWGAALGLLYFVADLSGTALAIGWLFDRTFGSTMLVLIAGGVEVVVGAVVGAVAGLVWPRRWQRRIAWRWRGLGAAVVFLAIVPASYGLRVGRDLTPPPQPRPPVSAAHPAPVLWIVLDATRADTVYGPHVGFPLAPHLRRFAAHALAFTDAESTAGWTIPATAALWTGIHNTTMDASAGYLPSWAPTMAERLRAAGYTTHAIIDNVLLEPRAGFGAGFETFFQRSGFRFAFSLPGFRLLPTLWRQKLRAVWPTFYYGSPRLTDVALRQIAAPHSAPLFLYVHYMDMHAPYYPHLKISPDPPGSAPADYYELRDACLAGTGKPTPAQLLFLRHRYETELRRTDGDLGRLLDAWHRRFGNNGLIMLTADHGEGFMDHGYLGHGNPLHREMVHVPLLMQFPAGTLPPDRATGHITTPVSDLDVLPTTLDALGIVPKSLVRMQGRSWMAWLRGDAPAPERPLISSHGRFGRRTYRYREGNWVYIKNMYYDHRPTERFLYDLSTDPTEHDNLIHRQAQRFAGISQRFEHLARALINARHNRGAGTSRASLESLRALGYVQ